MSNSSAAGYARSSVPALSHGRKRDLIVTRSNIYYSGGGSMITNPFRELAYYLADKGMYLDDDLLKDMEAIGAIKTYDYFLKRIEGLVRGVYSGNVAGEFIDIMANLIQGQLTDAYRRVWKDDGNEGPVPDYLSESLTEAIANQYNFVDQYFRDIVKARLDKTSIEPLMIRAGMWANRYKEAQSEAARLIALETGGKLQWVYGDADHCDTCSELNGLVAYATEWEISELKPQNAPNKFLLCGGWRCACRLVPTKRRRSPKVLDTLLTIGASL